MITYFSVSVCWLFSVDDETFGRVRENLYFTFQALTTVSKPTLAEREITSILVTAQKTSNLPYDVFPFRPNISLLGKVSESEYRALDCYTRATPTDVPVIRFDAPVIFTNAELLKNCIRNSLRTEEGKLKFRICSSYFG